MTAHTTGIGARSAGETGSEEGEEGVPTEHTEYTEAGVGKGESRWREKASRNTRKT